MELEQALWTYLSTRPALAQYVGAGSAARIYHDIIPQHAYAEATKLSCIVINRVGTGFDPGFCSTDRLVDASIQIDSYAMDRGEAWLLGRAVRDELIDFSGLLAGEVPVDRISCENDLPLLDPEPGLYRRSQTYRVWNEE